MKFVYFDIGGVLVRDFSATNKWEKLTTEWGVPLGRREEINKKFDDFEKEVCVGREVDDFLEILEKDFGIKLPKNYSMNDVFVKRFYRNEGLEEIVKEYKKKYKMGLLTNMYPGMLAAIKKNNLLPEIEWDVIIDSSIVKCKKPEEKIYKLAEKEAGVEPGEILFVDNKIKNLETATKMGWNIFYYNSADYGQSNKELAAFLR